MVSGRAVTNGAAPSSTAPSGAAERPGAPPARSAAAWRVRSRSAEAAGSATAALAFAAVLTLVASAATAADGISDATLAEAARTAKLADFDWNDEQCRRERTVEEWLAELGRDVVASVDWYGGACRLVNDVNPLDSGSDWCGGAEIRLKAPLSADDVPMIEVYFERPVEGRVAAPYAFRGTMLTADGEDYTRFSAHFEAGWESRFPGSVTGCGAE